MTAWCAAKRGHCADVHVALFAGGRWMKASMESNLMSRLSVALTPIAVAFLASEIGGQPGSGIAVDTRALWTVSSMSTKGDVVFGAVTGAAVTGADKVVIADGPNSRLVLLGAQETRYLGRKGSGPGEFSLPSWVGACRDMMHQQISVFSAAGAFVRRIFLQREGATPIAVATLACGAAGTLSLITRPAAPEKRGDAGSSPHREVRGDWYVFDQNGKTRVVGSVVVGEVSDTPGGNWLPRPLGAAGLLAVLPSAAVYGHSSSGMLVHQSLSTHQADTTYMRGATRPPTRAHVAAAIEGALAYSPAPLRQRMRPAISAISVPPVLPPFSALHSDAEGALWIVRSVPGDSQLRVDVHTRNGQLADVTIPGCSSLLGVGRFLLACLWENPDGDQEVRAFGVRRTAQR